MSIKSNFKDDIPKYWNVQVQEKGTHYWNNKHIGVVAYSVEEVCSLITDDNVLIVSINHIGPVNYSIETLK